MSPASTRVLTSYGMWVCACAALAAWTAVAKAGFTEVHPPSPGEVGHEELFEGIYGGDFVGSGTDLGHGLWTVFSNGAITATRMDDDDFAGPLLLLTASPGEADDDTWTDGTAVATANARFALFSQRLGYDLGMGFVTLVEVTGSGFSATGSGTVTFPQGSVWQWVRADGSTPTLVNAHYSDEPSNADGLDHMVTYHVSGIDGTSDEWPVWLIFWEDLNGPLGDASDPSNMGIPSDRDFNDLVVELVVSPECLDDAECDDGNLCTADICTAEKVCENPAEPDGKSCSDGLFCNGEEECWSGACMPGVAPCVDPYHCDEEGDCCLECIADDECDDGDECTEDTCDSTTGECVFTPIDPPPPGCGGGDGCTPGFWKQPHHVEYWTDYSPSDLFDDVFGVDGTGDRTLIQAAWSRGGKEFALMRHAVAALLNAASPEVDYAYTEAEVIAIVQDAYVTGEFNAAKDMLEAENERGCSVDKSRAGKPSQAARIRNQ